MKRGLIKEVWELSDKYILESGLSFVMLWLICYLISCCNNDLCTILQGNCGSNILQGTPNFSLSQFQTLKLGFKVKFPCKLYCTTRLKMFCSKQVIAGCS